MDIVAKGPAAVSLPLTLLRRVEWKSIRHREDSGLCGGQLGMMTGIDEVPSLSHAAAVRAKKPPVRAEGPPVHAEDPQVYLVVANFDAVACFGEAIPPSCVLLAGCTSDDCTSTGGESNSTGTRGCGCYSRQLVRAARVGVQ